MRIRIRGGVPSNLYLSILRKAYISNLSLLCRLEHFKKFVVVVVGGAWWVVVVESDFSVKL